MCLVSAYAIRSSIRIESWVRDGSLAQYLCQTFIRRTPLRSEHHELTRRQATSTVELGGPIAVNRTYAQDEKKATNRYYSQV